MDVAHDLWDVPLYDMQQNQKLSSTERTMAANIGACSSTSRVNTLHTNYESQTRAVLIPIEPIVQNIIAISGY